MQLCMSVIQLALNVHTVGKHFTLKIPIYLCMHAWRQSMTLYLFLYMDWYRPNTIPKLLAIVGDEP